MSTIDFCVWSPDEATFWQGWIAAGIVDADHNPTPEYANGFVISDQTSQGWVPTRPTGEVEIIPAMPIHDENGDPVLDDQGNPMMTEAQEVPIMEPVPGWHANVHVYGDLAAEMTYGLAQTDVDGNMLDVFDRTWATHIFALTEQSADPVTGFPAGYRNSDGVTYCDSRDLSSPTCVWA